MPGRRLPSALALTPRRAVAAMAFVDTGAQAADQLLILASGSLSVELREKGARPLAPQAAVIVPAGIWHRLIVQEPSVLIAITTRRNTVHEQG